MLLRVEDLKYKEVISVKDGMRLGSVCDVEIDTSNAHVCCLVIYGRLKWFGLLGREEDIIIGWENIALIGEDTILVNYCCPQRKKSFLNGLFG